MNWVDVPLQKQQISISKHRFLNGGTTQPRANEQIVINSGEINWGFKFKIISLERINKIFEEIQNPIATDNLETEPRNVTLNPKKVINKNHNREKGKKKKLKKAELNPIGEIKDPADTGSALKSEYLSTVPSEITNTLAADSGDKQFKNV